MYIINESGRIHRKPVIMVTAVVLRVEKNWQMREGRGRRLHHKLLHIFNPISIVPIKKFKL